jgi:hypothetical protein
MEQISGYVHQTGQYCGSAALANLATYYNWDFDEPTCFGLGGGIASMYVQPPESPWHGFVGRPPWLEELFFETIGASYYLAEGVDWETAWDNVQAHLDMAEPALLFLDPAALPGIEPGTHPLPHPVLAVGYDEKSVLIADGVRQDLVELSRADLRDAWQFDGLVSWENRHLVVTDPAMGVEHTDAGNREVRSETQVSNRAIRKTTGYMLDTREYQRTTGAPGDHGLDALQTLAAELPTWAESSDGAQAAAYTAACIDAFGDGAVFRGLYADALETLAPDAGIGGGQAERMQRIADEWTDVAAILRDIDEDDPEPALNEAASVVEAIAEQERSFFEHVRGELQ